MASSANIFLFGDEGSDVRSHLHARDLESRTDPYLNLLFQQTCDGLRREVVKLSTTERDEIPAFTTIEELCQSSRSRVAHAGIENALLCLSQIAHYIRYANSLRGPRDRHTESCVVGMSTGLLAAAAVALSPSVSTLIPLAVQVILVAFRLGLRVQTNVRNLQPAIRPIDCSPWSYVFSETNEIAVQGILKSFHQEQSTPRSNEAYISATGDAFVTVSGPPTTLEKVLELSTGLSIGVPRVAIFGPYHAPHLYDDVDVQDTLCSSDATLSRFLNQYHLTLPLLALNEGKRFDDRIRTTELLAGIVEVILRKTLRVQDIISECVKFTTASHAGNVQVISCDSSSAQGWLVTTLKGSVNATVDICEAIPPATPKASSQSPRTSRKAKLAIVGMAGRFPDAADHEKFWDLLEAGRDVHRKIPKDRFDVNKHYDPTGKIRNTSHTPFGCFIEEPGLFDPRFFNMSPREATQTDPMHRLGLTSAYEALEMAGYVPNRTPSTRLDRIGTFYGQTSDDWREINAAQDIDTYFITGGVRAFAPGRINYFFKFMGPSFSIDTACSSSAAAIQLACTSLWAGDCDTAVAGGLNVMTNSDIFSGLSRGQFLSKTGNCQTYDHNADGYCRGDGVGTLILKRLDDAEADNDRILGVILETETNHSSNAVSITHPHAQTQEILFKKVMDDAGVDPHDVDYVEMHGTGTQAGDGTEMLSVTNVFAPPSRSGTRRKSLHLGSVKANVGHGEAVSGVTAMIKCLLMLQNSTIPPHCGIKKTINQGFPEDLNARNVHIAFKPTPLTSKNGSPRKIFVNNFSAAGGNTATLLEDAPQRPVPEDDHRKQWVVAVSGKSKSALRANTRNLIQYIQKTEDLRLPDLSYTTTARRIHHNHRIAIACDTLGKATDILASKLDDAIDPVSSVPPKVAFCYTGQGSHYTALSNQLYNLSTSYRANLLSFNAIALSLGFPSFLPLIEGDSDAKDLSPVVVQLGLTCIQMALTRLWASWGVKPDVVIGHSLGEYAALNAAGVISVSETIFLVGERAKSLQNTCTPGSHAMLAVKSPKKFLDETLLEFPGIEVACVNSTKETVLGGSINDIDLVADRLALQGTKCTKLSTPFAFHTSQVDPILVDFELSARSIKFQKPQIPVISPLLATVLDEVNPVDAHYLARHAREPVDFYGALAAAQQLGLVNAMCAWIELGSHPICLGLVKCELGNDIIAAPTLRRGTAPYATIAESLSSLHLGGLSVDWNEYHRDFIGCVRMLDLPSYAWDDKNYWIQYTGDWNLHKGQVGGLAALAAPEAPKLSTTTVQRIVSEVVEVDKATVVIESDISRPELLKAISGHIVNGTALCPSSIYADMAMTIGEYVYKLLRPETKSIQMNVCQMEVFKPFVANDDGGKGQTLRLTATMDHTANRAKLFFSSGSGKGEAQHAKCFVDYGSGEAWLAEWQRHAYLIHGRIDSLKRAGSSGTAHRMLRGMAYKLFGAFVEYDERFRGMEEVILDSPQLEATASIAFQTKETDGKFLCSPYWIDSVCHLAGFIVNANDAVDSSKQVYVSHGWESMRFAEPLVASKKYRSYVKMQPLPGNMVAGDVYIFDGDRIIGVCGALKFQCIPRTLLNTFLPPKGGAATTPAAKRNAPAIKAAVSKPARSSPSKAKAPLKSAAPIPAKVLDIVAAEVGMPVDELSDAVEFINIGVDSLMSLSVSGRVREELDIDCQSSVFADYPTVGELKGYLKKYDSTISLEENSEDSDSAHNLSSDTASSYGAASTPTSPPGSPGEPFDGGSLSMIVRQTMSEEMDVEIAELISVEDLGTIGMDSLMALSILGILREKAGLALPADFLVDNPNITAIETALHITPPTPSKPKQTHMPAKPASPAPVSPAPVASLPVTTTPTKALSISKRAVLPDRQAGSVLLQGSPKTAEKEFWLVPDGGGAPTSYMFMDEISPKVAIWGLTSPFVKTPEEYIIGVVGIATKFVKEMKRRQPQGPYHIGGWSAGGVIAFEVTQQLINGGDVVETLFFIDSPCPLIIEPLPGSLHRFFGSIGLLGEGDGALEKLPPWLLPHFAASVHALSTYDAQPIEPSKCPKVFAMWCEDGVCKNPGDPRPDPYPRGHAEFLLENRTDFGPNLWDEFLDPEKFVTQHMPGNHFSMMKAPHVGRLVEFLREALL